MWNILILKARRFQMAVCTIQFFTVTQIKKNKIASYSLRVWPLSKLYILNQSEKNEGPIKANAS